MSALNLLTLNGVGYSKVAIQYTTGIEARIGHTNTKLLVLWSASSNFDNYTNSVVFWYLLHAVYRGLWESGGCRVVVAQ